MRRVIKKNRVIETLIAKGDDTRAQVISGSMSYPKFNYKNSQVKYPTLSSSASGNLIIRNILNLDSTNVLNQQQVITNMLGFAGDIGDSNMRNMYSAGLLEFSQRIHKMHLNKIQLLEFNYVSAITNSYELSYLDASKLTGVKYICTLDGTQKISMLNVRNLKLLEFLRIPRHTFNTLNLTDNIALKIIRLGEQVGGNITSVSLPLVNVLEELDLSDNKITTINLVLFPNLKSFKISNNTTLGTLDVSSATNLEVLEATNCGLTALDLTNNTNLKELVLGNFASSTNTNNISNIVGINDLVNLKKLEISRVDLVTTPYIDMDNFPLLEICIIRHLASVRYGTNINLNLNYVIVESALTTQTMDMSNFPNVKTLYCYTGYDKIGFINLNSLSGNVALRLASAKLETFVSLTNITSAAINITSTGIGFKEVTLKNQNHSTLNFQNNANLEKVNGLNFGNKTNVNISRCNLTELNIGSIGTISELSFGGGTESFTSIGGFATKSNSIAYFNMYPCAFTFSGEINGNFNSATFLRLENTNCEIFYNTTCVFPTTMRKVFIRPKDGVGLADPTTGGNQVSKLIVDLSTKTWTAGSLQNAFDSLYKIIDLRGNCKTPTPSGALTTALNLLTSKGVTVLTN